jgi:hypothetical protein
VTIYPYEVTTHGAAWWTWDEVFGVGGGGSGATIPLRPYPHTVRFRDVPGWLTPGDMGAGVLPGQTTSLTATYVAIPGAIQLTALQQRADGAFQFAFTNRPGVTFSAYGTTNPFLPFSQWTFLGAITDNPPGQFQFTDPQATNTPQRFYRVRWP